MPFKTQPFFQYKPLDTTQDCFRLCRLLPGSNDSPIICELTNETISFRNGEYSALSYTWGADEHQRWIKINGIAYSVQSNLLLALKAIRNRDQSLLVWIDAVCINQLDHAERTQQVSMMGEIYRNARQVLAWLGPEEDDSDAYFDYLSNKDTDGEDPQIQEARTTSAKIAWGHLNKRPYWRRAWIKQELILSRDTIFYCGSKKSEAGFFYSRATSDWKVEMDGHENHILQVYTHRNALRAGRQETLIDLLDRYSNSECLDVRDRVFAMYAMAADCQEPGRQIIDYNADVPALFFALLAHFEPTNVLESAAALQTALYIPATALQEYFDQVSTETKGAEFSGVEQLAVAYVRRLKSYSTSSSICNDLNVSTRDFITRSQLSMFTPGQLGKKDVWIQIHGTMYFLVMQYTLLGLRLRTILGTERAPEGYETVNAGTFKSGSACETLLDRTLRGRPRYPPSRGSVPLLTSIQLPRGMDFSASIEELFDTLLHLSVAKGLGLCLVTCQHALGLYGCALSRPVETKNIDREGRSKTYIYWTQKGL